VSSRCRIAGGGWRWPQRSAWGQAERPRQSSGAQERIQGLVHRLADGPVVHVAGSAGLAGERGLAGIAGIAGRAGRDRPAQRVPAEVVLELALHGVGEFALEPVDGMQREVDGEPVEVDVAVTRVDRAQRRLDRRPQHVGAHPGQAPLEGEPVRLRAGEVHIQHLPPDGDHRRIAHGDQPSGLVMSMSRARVTTQPFLVNAVRRTSFSIGSPGGNVTVTALPLARDGVPS